MSKYEELKKFIKDYESDAFSGENLSYNEASKVADGLIDYLIASADGTTLSDVLDDARERQ